MFSFQEDDCFDSAILPLSWVNFGKRKTSMESKILIDAFGLEQTMFLTVWLA